MSAVAPSWEPVTAVLSALTAGGLLVGAVLLGGSTACDTEIPLQQQQQNPGCVQGHTTDTGAVVFPGLPASSGDLKVDDLTGNPAGAGGVTFDGSVSNTGSSRFTDISVNVTDNGSVAEGIGVEVGPGGQKGVSFRIECNSGDKVTMFIEGTQANGNQSNLCFTFTCP